MMLEGSYIYVCMLFRGDQDSGGMKLNLIQLSCLECFFVCKGGLVSMWPTVRSGGGCGVGWSVKWAK